MAQKKELFDWKITFRDRSLHEISLLQQYTIHTGRNWLISFKNKFNTLFIELIREVFLSDLYTSTCRWQCSIFSSCSFALTIYFVFVLRRWSSGWGKNYSSIKVDAFVCTYYIYDAVRWRWRRRRREKKWVIFSALRNGMF